MPAGASEHFLFCAVEIDSLLLLLLLLLLLPGIRWTTQLSDGTSLWAVVDLSEN